MGKASPSDAELVTRACGGETQAFAMLIERHQDNMYNAIAHLMGSVQDAEDIAQEVFLSAFRNLRKFRREARFTTWLYGIMLNCVRTHWRRRRRRLDNVSLDAPAGEGGWHPDPPSPRAGPLEESARREAVEVVRCAIASLDVELREVIVLRDVEGLSYEELAGALGLPLGTVKSRLFRARSALKDKIVPAPAVD